MIAGARQLVDQLVDWRRRRRQTRPGRPESAAPAIVGLVLSLGLAVVLAVAGLELLLP